MQPLGVGLVYWQALAPLFEAGRELVSVLELEPQTLWEKSGAGSDWHYRVNQGLLLQVAALPQHKLMHGVGQPLGGLCDDPLDWRTPWAQCAQALQPAWASEHLSFNRFKDPHRAGGIEQTSFLLPPRQSPAGVAVAARNIARLRDASGVPVAFETGVNYLQPRADEMPDRDYFAQVAEAADCGILLDLHNLWVNQRNGRCSVAHVLEALPLHRVWELHLAGGSLLNGYWLDAHDRLADEQLLELAAQLIPRLPNLGALMFEILPQYIPGVGLDRIARQLEQLAALWRLRPAQQVHVPPQTPQRLPVSPAPWRQRVSPDAAGLVDLQAWEQTLGMLALGRELPPGDALPGLADDAGRWIFEQLVREFRCGRIVRVMRYSVLTLLRGLGPAALNALMQTYCRNCPSDIFTAMEADHFARYLRCKIDDRELNLPWLNEVLAFEHAMIRASLRGESSALDWSVDPTLLFAALESGEGLETLPPLALRMQVQAD